MPPDRRLLRDIHSIYHGIKIAQLEQGQWVHWFRFNRKATTSHPVYDTGPERVWYPPIKMPVWLGEFLRSVRNYDDDGLYLTNRTHVIMSYDAFFNSKMPDPDPSLQGHYADRVVYDGELFGVSTFLPRGRAADYFLTISADLITVAETEEAEDADNDFFKPWMRVPDITGGLTSLPRP